MLFFNPHPVCSLREHTKCGYIPSSMGTPYRMEMNKTILLPTIESVLRLLSNNQYTPPHTKCFYGDKIAIKHYINRDSNVVRIWKTKSFMDWLYDDFNTEHFMGALDYTICDDKVKIEYMNVNDRENVLYEKLKYKMADNDAMALNAAMIEFVKKIATEHKKPKLVVDVHNNLRIFNKYYSGNGFEITNQKAVDNPYWLEAEMYL